MQYALKLKSNPSNPTYETVFEPQYKTLFENKPNMVPSFGIRISSEFENMNLDLDNIAEFKVPDVPPWTFSQPRVLFSLHNDKKSQTDPLVFRTKFHELLSNFPSYNKWQMSWNAAVFNKLHSIMPSLGEWQPNYRIDRKEEVTLARLRIGHTFITHSFMLKGEDWPLCIPCQEPFSVKHFLLDCTDFRIIRSRFYRVSSLKELFDTVEPVRIFSFLKEIGLYDKI